MEIDIKAMVMDWIALAHAKKDSPEQERLFWVHAKNPDAGVIGNLAAGPMEDLLVHHGPAVIDRVEERARSDAAVAALLGGVWKNGIDDAVWKRVEAARSHVW